MPPKNRIILPVSGQFELTEECNQNCLHCYNYNRDSPLPHHTNPEIIAKEICNNQIFDITITGGEPLLRGPELIRVAEEFSKHNVDFEINTNLTLVSKDLLRALIPYKPHSILTSIHSYKEDIHDEISQRKGAFQGLIKGIGIVREEGYRVAVNMVVNNKNKEQVFDTGKFLIENFEIESFCATPIVYFPRKNYENLKISKQDSVKALDDLLELNRIYGINVETLNPPLRCMVGDNEKYSRFFNRACVAARRTFTVSPVGDVRPCSNSGEVYGNILENSLEEILSRTEKWRGRDAIPEECTPCVYVNSCRGGCRIMAESVGIFNSPHPFYNGPILTKRETQKAELKLDIKDSSVLLNPGRLRIRKEKNGLITVYLNPLTNILIDQDTLNLLRLTTSYEGTIGDLSKQYNIPIEILSSSLASFEKRGFITLEKLK